jgi:hypothetical protein
VPVAVFASLEEARVSVFVRGTSGLLGEELWLCC